MRRQAALALRRVANVHGWGMRSMAAAAEPAPVDDGSIELTVDGKPVRVAKGANVLMACEAAGVDIPRRATDWGCIPRASLQPGFGALRPQRELISSFRRSDAAMGRRQPSG